MREGSVEDRSTTVSTDASAGAAALTVASTVLVGRCVRAGVAVMSGCASAAGPSNTEGAGATVDAGPAAGIPEIFAAGAVAASAATDCVDDDARGTVVAGPGRGDERNRPGLDTWM